MKQNLPRIKSAWVSLLCLMATLSLSAQITIPPTWGINLNPDEIINDGQNDQINTEFATKMNLAFQLLEKNRVPNGLLKDQAFEFTELSAYSGMVTDTNYVTPVALKQIYNTLLMSRIHENASQFVNPQDYEQRWSDNRTATVITLSGLLFNYSQFKTDAATTGKLDVINNQYKDKYNNGVWQNPYDSKQVFAIAPSVRTYKGYNFSIKIPQNLWLTNVTQAIQSLQINVDDGLGYRNIAFGQNLAVDYTSNGIKHWLYKITLSDGQTLYSHSKIYVEEGVLTSGQATATNPLFGRVDINATTPYNGSYGSAKVVIDYASADHKIRKPLIIVEGFDPGVMVAPEEEYGYTTIKSFLITVNNSQSIQLKSILTDINTKQYDIIYVDWNNGVDYIQKNAYVLQSVIKYVNDQKVISGSTTPNVVWGQSMGGLIARYALKNMEDIGLAHQTNLYVSHDAPHQGANIPMGYQYFSRHAFHQYIKTPLAFAGGEVVLPLFTDGVTPLDYLMLQNTPAARQMLINYVDVDYSVNNTVHNSWQTELKAKGYPNIRKIAVSNGNHCAIPQNAPAGTQLLSFAGNYSTGWLTDIVLTTFPGVNATVFKTLSVFTNEPGFLMGILPGGNKLKLDFKINSLPSSSVNEIYKGKITYTKKLLWLIPINVTLTDKSFNSPSNTLPFDYYPGGTFDTGIRNSSSQSGNSFWQQAIVKFKMAINTEPTFSFVPSVSALDISKGNVVLTDSDYLLKYNSLIPPVSPKDSPFANFITSFGSSFVVAMDNYSSTNEHHISLHNTNSDWLAAEIDNIANNNQVFNCSYICSDVQISGTPSLCNSAMYSVINGATFYNWTITEGSDLVTILGNNTANVTLTQVGANSGFVTMSVTFGDNWTRCGNVVLTKRIWVGKPMFQINYDPSGLQIDLTVSPTYNSAGLEEQGINFNTINWSIISQDGGSVNLIGNGIYGTIQFSNSNSSAIINVAVTNNCGTENYSLVLGTGYDDSRIGNVEPLIAKISNDSYEIINLSTTISNKLKITVFDIYGKIAFKSNTNQINLSNVKAGIYIIRVLVNDKVLTLKIIKE